MKDPTYDKKLILANPAWELAWSLSEMQNDMAPMGWGCYISLAEMLLAIYDIKMNKKHPYYEEATQ